MLSSVEINMKMKEIAEKYPKYARLRLEGHSSMGRSIYSLSVGAGKKKLICTGGVHGRETVNPTVLVKIAKEYCAGCTNDFNEILQNYQIVMLPLLNPDGYELARQHNEKSHWKYNAYGIDINRDFPCESYCAQKSSPNPLSSIESRILVNVFRREESIGYIDFHSRGKEIYWYRAALDEDYNLRQKKIAKDLCQCSGYRLGSVEDEMPKSDSGGNTVQYYSEKYHLPAITVETVDESAEFPLNESLVRETFDEIKNIPLQYIKSWSAL